MSNEWKANAMDEVSSYMLRKRRESDRNLASARYAATREDWKECRLHTIAFLDSAELRFEIEESILFPAFEEETDGTIGLTHLMVLEHVRLRKFMEKLSQASIKNEKTGFLSCANALATAMQRHNLHEELYFYPMIEDWLAEKCTVLKAEITDLADDV